MCTKVSVQVATLSGRVGLLWKKENERKEERHHLALKGILFVTWMHVSASRRQLASISICL